MPPVKKHPIFIKPVTDYKRERLLWEKEYGHEGYIRLRNAYAKFGTTMDDLAYGMGFARDEDSTYDKNLKPKLQTEKALLELAKYPWKYEFAKKSFPELAKIWKQKMDKGEITMETLQPFGTGKESDKKYEEWENKQVEEYNESII